MTAVRPWRPMRAASFERIIVNFDDTPLQICNENNLAAMRGAPAGLRRVRALIATHNVFKTLEGLHSSRLAADRDKREEAEWTIKC